ncbi:MULTISPECIES: aromatic acid/H+ symport family MFS transporter [Caballeronia]|jgi:MFS transporter, AAHS family, 4-hydroxybenzoate transporter|uniref:4-hydroxybenzoate transporter n=1 Tax=Caballeronia zhejiangensis TaxID=871203 RepID=A0A656QLE5_9BURK|nr:MULTISPECIES: aromatic acid/H+ symport family MFS transporter [Caballeronia]KDR29071.1 4-hydroxybenzoate transporter [Caballeronia zhejiangensis]MCG7401926.1 aromatic acid/H+ symport family MFS transporter [Caballeronia zhejiangensis]MCI1047607.1 aromatic acid/H+ symport family MFS transporter [Caballeronia zhejiangensis]MDR5790910.1 aromatic acid/H+ symport family MFS transporter [Caballeronia sp. LP003]MDR5796353.1 aromatic acid/H+ symport family MFS transporter [Caballeronia sp. LZ008]
MTSGKTIDIKGFIDERPISAYQWLLVALCFLIVTADGMDVAIMGFVAPSIIADWHISRPAFGLVMSAAPIGLVIGALAAGPASDRIGRKWVLITSVFLFGVFTIATAFTNSPSSMALLRVLTGIGLGAAMPNTTTLLSEYAPQRKRALLITIMFTGFNLGSALIGFVAGWLIPVHGWRSVLIFGGALPLLLIPLQIWLLPESARLLAVRGATSQRIGKVLGRVCGARFDGSETFVSNEPPLPTKKPIGVLFSHGYGLMTAALWVTYFMGLLVIYLLTGWLPTLMKDAGLTVSAAANVTAMFQIGGTIGAIIVGWIMDKARPAPVISAAYLGGAVCVLGLAWIGALSSSLAVLVFAAGFCMSGAQTGLNAFAPGRYPTVARATGVSWMLGMGRFGSIFGSAFGGALLGLGWEFGAILAMLAVPATLAAISILVAQRTRADEAHAQTTAAH